MQYLKFLLAMMFSGSFVSVLAAPSDWCTLPATAADAPRVPTGAERKRILDAFRPKVEKTFGESIQFKVDHLKSACGWAFYKGQPLTLKGARPNYVKAFGKEGWDEGAWALLQKRKGKWVVVVSAIGDTDLSWLLTTPERRTYKTVWDIYTGLLTDAAIRQMIDEAPRQ